MDTARDDGGATGPVRFTFGDSRALCDDLLDLVRSGRKTASCGALRDVGAGEPMPQVGQCDIATDWDGNDALLLETTEVTNRRFRDVPEDFALAEGEGDYAAWHAAHVAYFDRTGGFDPDMQVMCVRFRLIEVLS